MNLDFKFSILVNSNLSLRLLIPRLKSTVTFWNKTLRVWWKRIFFKHKSLCVSAVQQKQLQQASPSRSKNQTTSHEPSKSEYTRKSLFFLFWFAILRVLHAFAPLFVADAKYRTKQPDYSRFIVALFEVKIYAMFEIFAKGPLKLTKKIIENAMGRFNKTEFKILKIMSRISNQLSDDNCLECTHYKENEDKWIFN